MECSMGIHTMRCFAFCVTTVILNCVFYELRYSYTVLCSMDAGSNVLNKWIQSTVDLQGVHEDIFLLNSLHSPPPLGHNHSCNQCSQHSDSDYYSSH